MAVEQEWKQGIFRPLILLHGNESYFIDKWTQFFESTIIPEENKSFDFDVFYGKDAKAKEVLASVFQFPLLGKQRLVILKDADKMREIETLEEALHSPPEHCIFLLTFREKKLDKRKKIFKGLPPDRSSVVEYKTPYENQWPAAAQAIAREQKVDVASNAWPTFLEKTGGNLALMDRELQKLALRYPGQTIQAKDIESTLSSNQQYNYFQLCKALGQKNLKQSYTILHFLIENQKAIHPIAGVGQIFAYFEKLIKLHGQPAGSSKAQIAKSLALSPYFIDEYIAAKQIYNLKKCVFIVGFLRTADAQLKGWQQPNISPEDVLKELIFKILNV